MAAEPWGQGGQKPPLDFLRGAAPPLKKELSPPSARFENFDLHPPPPVVRSRRDLKHKVICNPGLGENDLPPLELMRGG